MKSTFKIFKIENFDFLIIILMWRADGDIISRCSAMKRDINFSDPNITYFLKSFVTVTFMQFFLPDIY